jgi:hypothetical protein
VIKYDHNMCVDRTERARRYTELVMAGVKAYRKDEKDAACLRPLWRTPQSRVAARSRRGARALRARACARKAKARGPFRPR